jgi:prolyl-tRNA editing enzyme YbaK/EbsC (Cys-tRNA(Pro) deacylase)
LHFERIAQHLAVKRPTAAFFFQELGNGQFNAYMDSAGTRARVPAEPRRVRNSLGRRGAQKPGSHRHPTENEPNRKAYPIYIDELAEICEVLSVSAGVRGLQNLLAPQGHPRAVKATVAYIGKKK